MVLQPLSNTLAIQQNATKNIYFDTVASFIIPSNIHSFVFFSVESIHKLNGRSLSELFLHFLYRCIALEKKNFIFSLFSDFTVTVKKRLFHIFRVCTFMFTYFSSPNFIKIMFTKQFDLPKVITTQNHLFTFTLPAPPQRSPQLLLPLSLGAPDSATPPSSPRAALPASPSTPPAASIFPGKTQLHFSSISFNFPPRSSRFTHTRNNKDFLKAKTFLAYFLSYFSFWFNPPTFTELKNLDLDEMFINNSKLL